MHSTKQNITYLDGSITSIVSNNVNRFQQSTGSYRQKARLTTENSKIAKSFHPCQPARIAQADMVDTFCKCIKPPLFTENGSFVSSVCAFLLLLLFWSSLFSVVWPRLLSFVVSFILCFIVRANCTHKTEENASLSLPPSIKLILVWLR